MGGEGPGHAAAEIEATEGQVDQREIARLCAEEPGEEFGRRARRARFGNGRHDLGRRLAVLEAGLGRGEGIEPLETAPRQHILDARETVDRLDELREPEVLRGADGHPGMAAFEAATRRRPATSWTGAALKPVPTPTTSIGPARRGWGPGIRTRRLAGSRWPSAWPWA